LDITPHPASLRLLHDVFDNSVAIAIFDGVTVELRFDSTISLEHVENALPDYPLEEYAHRRRFERTGGKPGQLSFDDLNLGPSQNL
jgi:hypothetical protein